MIEAGKAPLTLSFVSDEIAPANHGMLLFLLLEDAGFPREPFQVHTHEEKHLTRCRLRETRRCSYVGHEFYTSSREEERRRRIITGAMFLVMQAEWKFKLVQRVHVPI